MSDPIAEALDRLLHQWRGNVPTRVTATTPITDVLDDIFGRQRAPGTTWQKQSGASLGVKPRSVEPYFARELTSVLTDVVRQQAVQTAQSFGLDGRDLSAMPRLHTIAQKMATVVTAEMERNTMRGARAIVQRARSEKHNVATALYSLLGTPPSQVDAAYEAFTQQASVLATLANTVRHDATEWGRYIGAVAGSRAAGQRLTKTWISVMDGRERPRHHELNDETIPLTDQWDDEGVLRVVPGGWNCRCKARYDVVVAKAFDQSEARDADGKWTAGGVELLHGTAAPFEAVDVSRLSRHANGFGFYMAYTRKQAEDYGGAVMEMTFHATPDELMWLDEPIAAQSPLVQKAFATLTGGAPTTAQDGFGMYEALREHVAQTHPGAAPQDLATAREVSRQLRDLGVKGSVYNGTHASGLPDRESADAQRMAFVAFDPAADLGPVRIAKSEGFTLFTTAAFCYGSTVHKAHGGGNPNHDEAGRFASDPAAGAAELRSKAAGHAAQEKAKGKFYNGLRSKGKVERDPRMDVVGEDVRLHNAAAGHYGDAAQHLDAVAAGQAAFDAPLVTTKLQRASDAERTIENPTRNPAFRAWFGDSKVVGTDGAPQRVYHGSSQRKTFTAFDPAKIGSATDSGELGAAFYFTTDEGTARKVAGATAAETTTPAPGKAWAHAGTGKVGAFYVALQNPLILKPDGWKWSKRALVQSAAGLDSSATSQQITAALQAKGHDGVILDYAGGGWAHKEIAVFSPSAIKSATGNTGMFDPTNHDIQKGADMLDETTAGRIEDGFDTILKAMDDEADDALDLSHVPECALITVKELPNGLVRIACSPFVPEGGDYPSAYKADQHTTDLVPRTGAWRGHLIALWADGTYLRRGETLYYIGADGWTEAAQQAILALVMDPDDAEPIAKAGGNPNHDDNTGRFTSKPSSAPMTKDGAALHAVLTAKRGRWVDSGYPTTHVREEDNTVVQSTNAHTVRSLFRRGLLGVSPHSGGAPGEISGGHFFLAANGPRPKPIAKAGGNPNHGDHGRFSSGPSRPAGKNNWQSTSTREKFAGVIHTLHTEAEVHREKARNHSFGSGPGHKLAATQHTAAATHLMHAADHMTAALQGTGTFHAATFRTHMKAAKTAAAGAKGLTTLTKMADDRRASLAKYNPNHDRSNGEFARGSGGAHDGDGPAGSAAGRGPGAKPVFGGAGARGGSDGAGHRGRDGSAPGFDARHGSGDADGARLLGQPVRTLGSFTPNAALAAQLTAQGKNAPTIHELDARDPAAVAGFRAGIQALKAASPFGAAVHVYEPEEYAAMRLFTTADGKSGFALKDDGDLCSLFSKGGDGPAALTLGIAQGATKLDCFDTVLPALYKKFGFVETARLKWNDEHAPPEWDKATFAAPNKGEPDVVFMAHRPGGSTAPAPYAADYDAAVASQTKVKKNAGGIGNPNHGAHGLFASAPGGGAAAEPVGAGAHAKAGIHGTAVPSKASDQLPPGYHIEGVDLGPDLTPYDTPKVKYLRALAKKQVQTADLPGREALRAKIEDDVWNEATPTQGHTIHLIMGGPGVGKSTACADRLVAEYGARLVDSDEVKKHIPEFDGGKGAGIVHVESSDINDKILARAAAQGDNIVHPIVGKTMAGLDKKITVLQNLGYKVHLHYVDLPPEIAVHRVLGRLESSDRFVDTDYVINDVNGHPKENFNQIKADPRLESATGYDNNVGRGEAPKLTYHRERSAVHKGAPGRGAGARSGRDGNGGARSAARHTPASSAVEKAMTPGDGHVDVPLGPPRKRRKAGDYAAVQAGLKNRAIVRAARLEKAHGGCPSCTFYTGVSKCFAYPEGIPAPYATGGVSHTVPHAGTGGFTYRRISNHDVVTKALDAGVGPHLAAWFASMAAGVRKSATLPTERVIVGFMYPNANPDGSLIKDTQGDIVTMRTLQKTIDDFMAGPRTLGIDHSFQDDKPVRIGEVRESYLLTKARRDHLGLPSDLPLGWVGAAYVEDEPAWQSVLSGERLAFSVGGSAHRIEIAV